MNSDSTDNSGLAFHSDENSDLFLSLSHGLVNGAAVSQQIIDLPIEKLSAAIASEGIQALRKRFLDNAADVVTPPALLALAEASAQTYEKPLSQPLRALLNKLAREAQELPPDTRPQADHSFRDLFKQLVDAWSYGALDTFASRFESLFQEVDHDSAQHIAGSAAPEPERVIKLAFETGALGNVVWSAVAALGEGQGVRRLLDLIRQAPPENRAAAAVAQQFANPTRLTLLLGEDPVDFGVVDALLAHMGPVAITPLLDALADARARETRRGLLDRVVAIGPQVCPQVLQRLGKDERWFVQRNMLTILKATGYPASKVQLDKYLTHADPRVRREAMQLQFNDPAQRDRALIEALKETDPQIVKIALQAVRQRLPDAAIPVIAKRVVEPDFPSEYRTVVLQLLGRSTSILALEPLLRFAMSGSTMLGKPKLAAKSPEMLIALSGLARNWRNDRRVAPLLAVARESKDREILGAAS